MMNWFFIILGIFLILYIFVTVIKGKFDIVESIFWLIGSVVILILSIWPNIIIWLSKIIGIEYPPSLLFLLVAVFLLLINFRNTQKIAKQREKIIFLGQEIAILKNKKDVSGDIYEQ